jgi:hypothetical protein
LKGAKLSDLREIFNDRKDYLLRRLDMVGVARKASNAGGGEPVEELEIVGVDEVDEPVREK